MAIDIRGAARVTDVTEQVIRDVHASIIEMVRKDFKDELQEQRKRIRRLERELFGVPGVGPE